MIAVYLAPLYILIHLYLLRWVLLWVGMFHPVLRTLPVQLGVGGAFTAAALAILVGFLLPRGRLRRVTRKVGNQWLGIAFYFTATTALADLLRVTRRHFAYELPARLRPFTDLRVTGTVCGLCMLALCLWSAANACRLRTTPYAVTIHKNGGKYRELRVVLAADLHMGDNIGCRHIRRMVNAINAQQPDLVVLAGDIFDNEFDALEDPDQLAALLRGIHSRCGVYACYGNHDIAERILAGFTFDPKAPKASDPRMDAFLQDAHIRLLMDEAVVIEDSFILYGRPDAERPGRGIDRRKTPAELTAGLDQTMPILVMDHQPRELQALADAGVDLDLCGHTHGGQMFPANLTVNALWENPCGLLQKGHMTNIVTSGVGLFGPSMRTGSRAEICSIQVRFDG